MIQYLIHASLIWLICLLLYEFWLSKESFHQFNRIYLLLGLFSGFLIPLVHLKASLYERYDSVQHAVFQANRVKQAVESTKVSDRISSIESSVIPIEQILWSLYIVGLIIGLVFLVKQILFLIRLYRNGVKYNEQGLTIIKTGEVHCPFSFFNMLFINDPSHYHPDQWTILLDHEKEHKHQWHSIDNLLVILCKLVCWFHPLLYIFHHKLRMIHEFQADHVASKDTYHYGSFLLEQQLLQGAPLIAHSFHHSPLKTRITMLTKTKSSQRKILKYLIVFPLLLLCILFCTQTTFSGQLNSNKKKVIFKGNRIEFENLKVIPFNYMGTFKKQKKIFVNVSLPDSVPIIDGLSGKLRMEKVLTNRMPVVINGKSIYGKEEQYLHPDYHWNYNDPVFLGKGESMDHYIFSQLRGELDKLDNGTYIFHLNSMVVDDQGKIAYYENTGLETFVGSSEKKPLNSDKLMKTIEQGLTKVLDGSIKFKPALKDGKPVNVRFAFGNYMIQVKNHQARLVERTGC